MARRPQIIEQFEDWRPPFDVTRVVDRLLDSLDDRHFVGLRSLVLTNVVGRSKRKEREARSRRGGDGIVLARYHQPWRGELPLCQHGARQVPRLRLL